MSWKIYGHIFELEPFFFVELTIIDLLDAAKASLRVAILSWRNRFRKKKYVEKRFSSKQVDQPCWSICINITSRCAGLGANSFSDRSPRLPTDVFPACCSISGCGSSSGYLCWLRCAIQKKFHWCGSCCIFCAFSGVHNEDEIKAKDFCVVFGQITCFASSHSLTSIFCYCFHFSYIVFLPQKIVFSETSTWRNPIVFASSFKTYHYSLRHRD